MLDRRLMMAQATAGPPGSGIVTDGLVFHLDGRNRGGQPLKWIDTVSRITFEPATAPDGTAAVTDLTNGVGFLERSYYNGMMSKTTARFLTGNGTFQFCIRPQQKKNFRIFAQPNTTENNWNVGLYGSTWVVGSKAPERMPTYLKNQDTGTFSFSREVGYMNGKWSAKGKPDHWTPLGNYIALGNNGNSGDGYVGIIHEIRIYNRQLTESEVLQNQQYDIDTYFGGVTP